MKPDAYKIAEDVIFLQKNNNQEGISKINKRKFKSSEINKELSERKSITVHTVNSIIENFEKYIEITFTLKNIDVLIRSERRRNTIQVVLCIFTAICALIGTIIGGILGNSDLIKTLFK